MNNARMSLFALIAIIGVAGCAPNAAPPVDPSKDIAALKAMQDRELAVVSTCNVDSAITVYAADVVMMPPGEPVFTGTDATKKWIGDLCKDFTVAGAYSSADVQVAGDWAVVRYAGTLTLTPKKGGKPMAEVIKGNHIYKRQADGAWLITQDVWNADAPPPAQAK